MNILVITDFYPNLTIPHEGIFVYQQLREINKYANITVFVPQIIYPPLKRYEKVKREFDLYIDDKRYKVFIIKYWQIPIIGEWIMPFIFIFRMRRVIKKKKIDFDLIHAFWAYRSGYWAYGLAKHFKKKYIITLLGSDVNYWLHEHFKKPRIEKAIANADRIIGLSRDLLKKIKYLNVTSRQKWIPNGMDPQDFHPRRGGKLKSTEGIKIICIANHYYVKGVDILLQAAAELKSSLIDFSIILIGDGPERLKLEQLSEKLFLKKQVIFKGIISHQQIPDYLRESDLLVIPSRNEGFGTVILEALACGIPVIGSKVGGIPEALEYGKYGILVEPESPVKLAEAIIKSQKEKPSREMLIKYAARFSWSVVAREIHAVYQDVLKQTD